MLRCELCINSDKPEMCKGCIDFSKFKTDSTHRQIEELRKEVARLEQIIEANKFLAKQDCQKRRKRIFEEIKQYIISKREELYHKKQKQMSLKPMDKQVVAMIGGKLKSLQCMLDKVEALKAKEE